MLSSFYDKFFSQQYLNIFIASTKLYTPRYSLLMLLLFLIAGLPPVGIFFIKFNFLVSASIELTIALQIAIFTNLLLGMFYYLQVFNFTHKLSYLTSRRYKDLKYSAVNVRIRYCLNTVRYEYFYFLLSYLIINFLFIYFFTDVFNLFLNFTI